MHDSRTRKLHDRSSAARCIIVPGVRAMGQTGREMPILCRPSREPDGHVSVALAVLDFRTHERIPDDI